jgi:hypothetical protein
MWAVGIVPILVLVVPLGLQVVEAHWVEHRAGVLPGTRKPEKSLSVVAPPQPERRGAAPARTPRPTPERTSISMAGA